MTSIDTFQFVGRRVPFVKMHGCGNDYIFFNGFDVDIPNPGELARVLSDRHKGVGGDGLVLMLPSEVADAAMRMFNADGSEADNCGNALRCLGKYLYENGTFTTPNVKIETLSGIKDMEMTIVDGRVLAAKVNMGKAELAPEKIPVNLSGEAIIQRKVNITRQPYEITCVNMGNPHAVIFHHDIDHFDLETIGPMFEHANLFPERVNLEIAQMVSRNYLRMRIWERGTGETMACGTGACAAAVAAVQLGFCDKDTDIKVEVRGGILTINYTDEAVYMSGECIKVYEGVVKI
ncbi:MAG: diaminopimelate epimerase [Defluviitaleaceae bacterium]|nr:diaminopimelate epimerase [Defluviitaleaceae bacterium]